MMQVRRSLLMGALLKLSPMALEVISGIPVAMVERLTEREVFGGGSEDQVVAVLNIVFAWYLQHKLA